MGSEESYQGVCFGHAFFKAHQYAATYEIFGKKLTYVSIKIGHGDIQKCKTWFKKSLKGYGLKHVLNLVWLQGS